MDAEKFWRETKFRKGSKNSIMQEYYIFLHDVAEPVQDGLFDAVEKGIVKSGWLAAYGFSHNYHYNWFLENGYGWKKEQTPVWEFRYHLREFKQDVEELRQKLRNVGVEI